MATDGCVSCGASISGVSLWCDACYYPRKCDWCDQKIATYFDSYTAWDWEVCRACFATLADDAKPAD